MPLLLLVTVWLLGGKDTLSSFFLYETFKLPVQTSVFELFLHSVGINIQQLCLGSRNSTIGR